MDEDKRRLKNWFFFIAMVFLTVGAGFSLGIIVDHQKIKAVQKWPIQEGRLITQVVKTNKQGGVDQSVLYEYKVGNLTYKGSTVAPNRFTEGEHEFFRGEKNGQYTVMVHYNAENPIESYLIDRFDPYSGAGIIYAGAALVFGVIFGAIGLLMQKNSSGSGAESEEDPVSGPGQSYTDSSEAEDLDKIEA
ncbi:DUF3592 domain-containing protein [bacterium]|nr:DUF3592 domain-containing protein [bacterium]